MKYEPDKKLNKNAPVGVSERQTPPLLTLALLFLILLVYNSYQSSHNPLWITRNVFQLEQVLNLINNHNYGQLINLLFMTNLVNVNVWQLLASIYFVALFAIPVEKRLGPIRFISLVVFACTLPWIVQFFDLHYCSAWPIIFEQPRQDFYYFGPYCIILALAGAYSILIPKKEVDMTNSRLYRKDRTEIFNRAQSKPMNARFGLAPSLFFSASIVYVFASHFINNYFYKDYDAIGLYAGIVAWGLGYVMASFIKFGIEDSYQEHPLKHAAIKHYYELLDLDVGHENAVKGAAKSLGLPDYQVEDWVKKTKGKLRPT